MRRRWCVYWLLLSSSWAFAAGNSWSAQSSHDSAVAMLPVTTSSGAARKSFERAMQNFEQYRLAQTLQDLKQATKADPKFAQAYILIAKVSKDPAEQSAARKRAKELARGASPGEQLLIRWLANAQENDYLPAIAAMNDLLSEYPKDYRLAFLAGDWLTLQQRYEQATTVLNHAVALLPDYPAALNDLGYTYAFAGNFEKAFATMERYIALAPDEPNPHDSYGEILRMAGKFEPAVEQYRMSIRMDPNFGSELGVADTYALMGKEQDARDEYERAMVFASTNYDKVYYELQSAVTWMRENDRKQSEKALAEFAKHAHTAGLAQLEAEAHRVIAMEDPDPKVALRQLQAGQNALLEEHQISASDRDEELARILQVRATRLAQAQDLEGADKTVNQLETMVGLSRSVVIEVSYHAAAGAVLVARERYEEAITHLEENSDDPVSMQLLLQAYQHTGAAAQAKALASKLSSLNVPTVEQAMVVPAFRASLISQAAQP